MCNSWHTDSFHYHVSFCYSVCPAEAELSEALACSFLAATDVLCSSVNMVYCWLKCHVIGYRHTCATMCHRASMTIACCYNHYKPYTQQLLLNEIVSAMKSLLSTVFLHIEWKYRVFYWINHPA